MGFQTDHEDDIMTDTNTNTTNLSDIVEGEYVKSLENQRNEMMTQLTKAQIRNNVLTQHITILEREIQSLRKQIEDANPEESAPPAS